MPKIYTYYKSTPAYEDSFRVWCTSSCRCAVGVVSSSFSTGSCSATEAFVTVDGRGTVVTIDELKRVLKELIASKRKANKKRTTRKKVLV